MYFPKGFDLGESIEIARLVSCAYEQFTAFEEDSAWKLPEDYRLIREINYAYETRNPWDRGNAKFETRVKQGLLKKSVVAVPFGFVARRKKKTFVIFRGTKTVKEWISNFNTKFQECFIPGFGNVHEGFQTTFLNFRGAVSDAVGSVQAGDVRIGGHSLGAALGTFAALDIAINLKSRVKALYTFGSPRIGDNLFAQRFNLAMGRRSFRISNTSDIVSSIPLPIPLAGIVGGYFSHIDTPVDFTLQADDIEKNHAMQTYIEALEAQVKKGFFAFLRNG